MALHRIPCSDSVARKQGGHHRVVAGGRGTAGQLGEGIAASASPSSACSAVSADTSRRLPDASAIARWNRLSASR